MVAAYILAGELYHSNGDYSRAFSRYQELFGPFVARKQKAASRFGSVLVPKSALGLSLRNQLMKAMSIPFVAKLAFGRQFMDEIKLPEY
jgi:2-polyprenyl-6-methoxyphenol hydroxylase-like FAD-dependent oxidoreductase